MLHFDKVFRVRITEQQETDLSKALTHWKQRNSWERVGFFWRIILELGLKAYRKQTKND